MYTKVFGFRNVFWKKCTFVMLPLILVCFGCFAAIIVAQSQVDHPNVPGFKPTDGEKGEISECLKKAHIALRKNGPIKAVEDFKICTRKFPKSPFPFLGLAMTYFMAQKLDEAADQFKQVLKIDPDNQEARAMLGKIYSLDKNKLALAEDLLKEVVRKNPYHFDARIDLARAYARQKKIKKALAQFGIVLSTEKRFARYHLELGSLFMAGGALPQARKEFERALVLYPNLDQAKKQLKKLEQKEAKQKSKALTPNDKPEKSPK
jgi:tetratricopeptide (TPR) repeat protein